ncbi:SCO family protein [Solimonas marina]|uniref:Cytochrome oxidase assembly protein n=1 Tax=Solimonas marina TaxID=2714601 RepID=A0A969W907_9GAMM|nr:cytochrome oxidase assembly protein [Solimonas marina]NKF22213.1 cytochrome oxidase assembly protein [Solimonas marina]
MNQVPRRRTQFYLLVLLFFGPLAAAVLLYFVFPQWQPQGRTNYGELITPARPLPTLALVDADGGAHGDEALRGRWTWLFVGGGACDPGCAEQLYQYRQIRTLLNDKRRRVRRVYIAPDAAALPALRQQLATLHPDLQLYAPADAAAATTLHDALRAPGTAAGSPGVVYLIDPLGNWLMVYRPDADSKGVLADIKKLLSISQIDA